MKSAHSQSVLLFQHPSRRVRRTELRAFWLELSSGIAGQSSASCLITTDAELRRMNREFLHKDYATDVLSFPSGEDHDGGDAETAGEIAISLDRATAQAAELGHDVEQELRILMLHGLLHLTGLDHETDSGEMARAEMKWRKKLGLPLGLIERAAKQLKKASKKALL